MEKMLLELLEQEDFSAVAKELSRFSGEQAAAFLCELDEGALVPVCTELEPDLLAETLLLLPPRLQELLLSALPNEELKEAMDEVPDEERLDLIEDIPQKLAWRVAETEDVAALLKERKFSVLKPLVSAMQAADIAAAFEGLDKAEEVLLFRILPKDLAAETFVELDRDVQKSLIQTLSGGELKEVLDELFLDDTVDLIEEMPASVVKKLLAHTGKETRAYINELLKYPKDSAGSIMTIEFVSLRQQMTVEEAFERIRKIAIDKETIYTCYVTDGKKRLVGLVTAKALMLAQKDAKIADLMEENVIYALTTDDKEEVARTISDYGFLALPIVDHETRLVGIVTVDDAIDVLEEENTEDIAKMAATTPSDKPYLKTSVFSIWKNRIPWLLVLMVSATFTGLILNTYEGRLNAISSALFACVPMLMDTGGNSGAQASVTIIRSLALGEVRSRDLLRVLWKELRASVLLGLTLGLACFAKLMLIDNLLFGFDGYTPLRCLVVSLSLFITVVIAKIVGCSLPILAKKCKLDPAVVASPFITTIVDALALILYCSLAVWILA